MTMRELIAVVFTIQMSFGQFAFAQGVPPPPDPNVPPQTQGSAPPPPPGSQDAPPANAPIPKASPGGSGKHIGEHKHAKVSDCYQEIHCTDFFKQFEQDPEAMRMIHEQLADHRKLGCNALRDTEFLRKMLNRYDVDTEATATIPGICKECKPAFHRMVAQASEDGVKAKLGTLKLLEAAQCAAAATPHNAHEEAVPESAQTAPPLPPRRPPPDLELPPPDNSPHRDSSYRDTHHEIVTDDGGGQAPASGGGGFMNSNLMWGLGGFGLGLIGGMMLANRNQQPQYQMPYWQQLGPRPPPFGMGGPFGGSPFMNRPGLPNMYPAPGGMGGIGGIGGMGGPPNILPYGGAYGQPGYNSMMPVGGYGGGVGGYNYGLGTNFGGGTGFSTPIYNGGAYPPMILPYH